MINQTTAVANAVRRVSVKSTATARERSRQVCWKKFTTGAKIQAIAQAAKNGMSTGLSQRSASTQTTTAATKSKPRTKRSKLMVGFRSSMFIVYI